MVWVPYDVTRVDCPPENFEKSNFFTMFGDLWRTNRKWAGPNFFTPGSRVTILGGVAKIVGVACQGTPPHEFENFEIFQYSNINCD